MELLIALALAALVVMAAASPARAAAQDSGAGSPPRIVAVEPVRAGELLECRIRTENLPGAKLTSSMKSGLPSAIEMALEVLDPKDKVLDARHITFRLAFDLWEETFRVEGGGTERDFTSQEELEAFLADLPRLPVASLERLRDAAARRESLRVRVGLVLHSIAPRESEKLGDWVAGPPRTTEPVGSEDGREVSVGLGTMIRWFFEGGRAKAEIAALGISAPFSIADLREEAAP